MQTLEKFFHMELLFEAIENFRFYRSERIVNNDWNFILKEFLEIL